MRRTWHLPRWAQSGLLALAGVALGAGVYLGYQQFVGNQFELPSGRSDKVTITTPEGEEKEIMVTDGTKHSIPLDEVIAGGPPKDGIPSIDQPVFSSPDDLPAWFDPEGLGIALNFRGANRFYPYQVMVRHEIVNDTIDGQRTLVTYCPLCFSGIVFDPVVEGERVEFGVSGKLWNSNLLMYNRGDADKESLWSQITGEAVVGELTGHGLSVVSSDITTFERWRSQHSRGEVLIGETGNLRSYSFIPYGGDLTDIKPFFPTSHEDDRLVYNAFVLGIEIEGRAKAYHVPAIERDKRVEDEFAGRTIVAEWDESLAAARLFEKQANGQLKRLNPFTSFWFSWVAVHPDTELYK